MSVSVGLVDGSGVIENVIVVEDPATFVPPLGFTIIQSDDIAIGRQVVDGVVQVPPEEPAPPVVPAQISALQMLSVLAINGTITEAEAVNRSTLPASFTPALAGMTDEEQTVFRIRWANLTTVPRTDPIIATLGTILGLNDTQIDALFIQAAAL